MSIFNETNGTETKTTEQRLSELFEEYKQLPQKQREHVGFGKFLQVKTIMAIENASADVADAIKRYR